MKKILSFIRSLFTIDRSMDYYRIERQEKFDKNEARKNIKNKHF